MIHQARIRAGVGKILQELYASPILWLEGFIRKTGTRQSGARCSASNPAVTMMGITESCGPIRLYAGARSRVSGEGCERSRLSHCWHRRGCHRRNGRAVASSGARSGHGPESISDLNIAAGACSIPRCNWRASDCSGIYLMNDQTGEFTWRHIAIGGNFRRADRPL